MKVLIGTTNPSKVKRFEELLAGCDIEFCTLNDLGIIQEPEESGGNPEENAVIKAKHYGQFFDIVICNDSGLYFDSLPLDDSRQPGLNIRTPGGSERLDDESMIKYYSGLVHSLGGKVSAYYLDGIAVYNKGAIHSFMENSEATRASAFYMVDAPSDKRHEGWPLDSLSLNRNTMTYFVDKGNNIYDKVEENIMLGEYRKRLIRFLKDSLGIGQLMEKTVVGEVHKMKAALVACSDPMLLYQKDDIQKLKMLLETEGLEVVVSSHLFDSVENLSARDKANELMGYFRDSGMDFIFDISGGDIANSVLQESDYDVIRESGAVFYGYSDLTTVLNAIYTRSGRETVNYQVRNLLYDHAETVRSYFREHILTQNITGNDLECRFLRGDAMKGRVLGGNIRCFLKLAGTPYWPDLNNAILLLEAYSGNAMKMTTYLHQLKQIGVFEQVRGILLGTFSEMEKKKHNPTIEELILSIVPSKLPIAVTRYIGHGTNARAIIIGKEYDFGNK